jgi:hypothetical protein
VNPDRRAQVTGAAVAAAIVALGIGFGVGYGVAPSHDGSRMERVGPERGRAGLLPDGRFPGRGQFPGGQLPRGNGNGNPGTSTPSAPSSSPSR